MSLSAVSALTHDLYKSPIRTELQWTWGAPHEVIIWAVVFGPGLDPDVGEWIEIGRGMIDVPSDKLRFAKS